VASLDERLVRPELITHYPTRTRPYEYLRSPSELEIGKFVQGFTYDGDEIVVLILGRVREPWFMESFYYYEVAKCD
jgi:hypothetical protein